MLVYVCKRLILFIPILFVVATLVFFLIRLVPGDPVDFILGDNALAESRQSLIIAHHFDKPLLTQYAYYWQDLLQGNLGKSYFSDKNVTTLIASRYWATVQLAVMALFWAMLIAFPCGILSALRSQTLSDKTILLFSLLGISIPGFYLGPILALVFSVWLDIFPLSGRDLPGSIFLPSLTLGLAMSAILTRMVRSTMIEVLRKEYVRTAKAKGLSALVVVIKHAFRTALIPVVAVLGLQIGALLTGAVVTEKIFSWPGIGTLMLEAISRRDYALVQGCVLLIATTYVVVNLLTDLVYFFLDPRLKI